MKTWVKVLLGIAAGVAALLALIVALMVRTGRWEQAKRFSGGMFRVTAGARALERYEKEHPFRIPPDGRISPERLEAYLEVCAALKPCEGPYKKWMAEHLGRKGDFKDAAEVLSFMGEAVGLLQRELGQRQMSTREFAWTHAAVREARRELAERSGSPKAAEALALLRRTAQDPQVPTGLRARLSAELERIEGKAQGPSPNATLLEGRLERFTAVDPGDLADIFLGAVSQGSRTARPPVGGTPN
jgi:hypothetical protein